MAKMTVEEIMEAVNVSRETAEQLYASFEELENGTPGTPYND